MEGQRDDTVFYTDGFTAMLACNKKHKHYAIHSIGITDVVMLPYYASTSELQ